MRHARPTKHRRLTAVAAATAMGGVSMAALAVPAHASEVVIDLTDRPTGDGWTNSHAYELDYTCGADGTATFEGSGQVKRPS